LRREAPQALACQVGKRGDEIKVPVDLLQAGLSMVAPDPILPRASSTWSRRSISMP
jgi:hypothetical protein